MKEARKDLEKKALELSHTTESIQTESKKRTSLGKRRLQEEYQLSESSRMTKNLKKEDDETKRQLELKEKELHFLRQQERHQRESAELKIAEKEVEIRSLKEKLLKEERDEMEEQLKFMELELHSLRQQEKHQRDSAEVHIQAVIKEKEAEIRVLKEKVSQVEHELNLEKVKNDKLRECLHLTTIELTRQCERVRGLERHRAEMERERSLVDIRMIIETAKRKVGITFLSIML